jgi:hypothetical protein
MVVAISSLRGRGTAAAIQHELSAGSDHALQVPATLPC